MKHNGTRAYTADGYQTSDAFESIIAGDVNPNHISGGWVLDFAGAEKARQWLLERESNPRCAGIIKRTHKVSTLRSIAWNLACGLDGR